MPISERTGEPVANRPSLAEVQRLVGEGVLGVLPDRVHEVDGRLVAAFRPDTQVIRVAAEAESLSVELMAPDEAELAMYTQYAADWVLPALVCAGMSVPCQILATLLAARIESFRRRSEEPPMVLFREVIEEDGKLTERELRGPADEIEAFLRARIESGDGS